MGGKRVKITLGATHEEMIQEIREAMGPGTSEAAAIREAIAWGWGAYIHGALRKGVPIE